jgi:hypothetical protein
LFTAGIAMNGLPGLVRHRDALSALVMSDALLAEAHHNVANRATSVVDRNGLICAICGISAICVSFSNCGRSLTMSAWSFHPKPTQMALIPQMAQISKHSGTGP